MSADARLREAAVRNALATAFSMTDPLALPAIGDELLAALRDSEPAGALDRAALMRIEGWSRFYKSEPGTQIRRSLELIHRETTARLSATPDTETGETS